MIGEQHRDLLTAAHILHQLDARDQQAAAYDHASHGCPFEDSQIACPVGCDRPDHIANEALAFFGGIAR